MRALAVCLALALAACATVERSATTFEPVRSESSFVVYRFVVFGDAALPVPTPETEGARIRVLEEWLAANKLGTRYEIIERSVVLRTRTTFGVDVHDVHYLVRVPLVR